MFISRKGLSDIVTNVLIILLVLVAVGIIWAFVRPTINQGAGQLEGQSDCLAIQVEPVKCTHVGTTYTVNYKRSTGGSDDGIQSLKFIFKNNAGTVVKDSSALATKPKQLESGSDTNIANGPTFTSGADPLSVSMAVVVPTTNGGKTCQEGTASVVCS